VTHDDTIFQKVNIRPFSIVSSQFQMPAPAAHGTPHSANFGGHRYEVVLPHIQQVAPLLAQQIDERKDSSFEFPKFVSPAAFSQFLNVCQGQNLQMTRETCYPLLFLAATFQVAKLTKLIRTRVFKKPTEFAIECLLFDIDSQVPTRELEDLLKSCFFDCPIADLVRVDVSILCRIIRFPTSNNEVFAKTFTVCCQLYQRLGSKASVLFTGVNRLLLNQSQRESLKSLKDFQWFLLDTAITGKVRAQLKANQDKIASLEGKVSEMNSKLVSASQLGEKINEIERNKRERLEQLDVEVARKSEIINLRNEIQRFRESTITTTASNLAKLRSDFNAFTQTQQTTIDDLTQQIRQLEPTVGSKISILKTELEKLRDSTVNPTVTNFSKLQSDFTNLKQTEQTSLEDLKHRMSLVNELADSNVTSIPNLKSELSKARSILGIIQIFVVTLRQHHITMDVWLTDKVEDVKKMIQEREGISVNDQRLIHNAKQMENGNSLKDYGIRAGDTINVVARLVG
jgi:hypothetical protein